MRRYNSCTFHEVYLNKFPWNIILCSLLVFSVSDKLISDVDIRLTYRKNKANFNLINELNYNESLRMQ